MAEEQDDKKEKQVVFLKKKNYKGLVFYQKTICVYDITYYFTEHFLHKGDRTIDQMVQAARSGKQNIIEGTEAAMTSLETEIKLNNVARASLGELLADYEDYARVRNIAVWGEEHPRTPRLRKFCYSHNRPEDYSPLLSKMTAEEILNIAITLIHQIDAAMGKYLKILQDNFAKNGGLREKMAKIRKENKDKNKDNNENKS